MNREIKFRGKRVDNGQWVYGFVVINKDGTAWIKNTDYNVNNNRIDIIPYQVHPETVGQYTGLKDKNKNEIYEGDVMYHESHEVATLVKWIDKFVCFAGESLEVAGTIYYYQSIDQRRLVIKGNIHDNPKLINK